MVNASGVQPDPTHNHAGGRTCCCEIAVAVPSTTAASITNPCAARLAEVAASTSEAYGGGSWPSCPHLDDARSPMFHQESPNPRTLGRRHQDQDEPAPSLC